LRIQNYEYIMNVEHQTSDSNFEERYLNFTIHLSNHTTLNT